MFVPKKALLMASQQKLYVEDVFSTWTYTGNGATQSIVNGIDLAGKGGLVWIKARGLTIGHNIVDSARGTSSVLSTNTSDAAGNNNTVVTTLNSDGFTVGTSGGSNSNLQTYVSWTFRKAPKFFDVVTWTGNGVAGRQIAHTLRVKPGLVVIKRTDSSIDGGFDADWRVCARASDGEYWHGAAAASFSLNSTAAAGQKYNNDHLLTDTWFNPTVAAGFTDMGNNVGGSYVAYLFAHDPSPDGIIQCGSFTTDGSGNATVTLGWEPQALLPVKRASGTGGWSMIDEARGFVVSSGGSPSARLFANTADPESNDNGWTRTATGFGLIGGSASSTYIFVAIRRGPMRVPTSGTQVLDLIPYTGTGVIDRDIATAFNGDVAFEKARNDTSAFFCCSRLRGDPARLETSSTSAENTVNPLLRFTNKSKSIRLTSTTANDTGINHMLYVLRRAPGVFDEVCYTGTGVAKTEAHNLGAVPEMMIFKLRSTVDIWFVYHKDLGASGFLRLNGDNAVGSSSTYWSNTAPTASVFTVGTANGTNQSGQTLIALLFATLPGISKIGSYTGNGTSQTIDCGFTGGARFILVKRTDAAGDWYVWDTARGIVAANDPHLSLNTTAAEVTTDDSVDPAAVGFIVNQNGATNINVNGATYIFLSIA